MPGWGGWFGRLGIFAAELVVVLLLIFLSGKMLGLLWTLLLLELLLSLLPLLPIWWTLGTVSGLRRHVPSAVLGFLDAAQRTSFRGLYLDVIALTAMVLMAVPLIDRFFSAFVEGGTPEELDASHFRLLGTSVSILLIALSVFSSQAFFRGRRAGVMGVLPTFFSVVVGTVSSVIAISLARGEFSGGVKGLQEANPQAFASPAVAVMGMVMLLFFGLCCVLLIAGWMHLLSRIVHRPAANAKA